MDPEYPKSELRLVATSVADDLGYRVLVDLATILSEQEARKDCRLIGGHMVTLHVHRWGLGPELYRETVDADLGITTVAVRQLDISEPSRSSAMPKPQALVSRSQSMGTTAVRLLMFSFRRTRAEPERPSNMGN